MVKSLRNIKEHSVPPRSLSHSEEMCSKSNQMGKTLNREFKPHCACDVYKNYILF